MSNVRKKNQKLWTHLLKELDDFEVQAGWFENTTYEDGKPIGGIAAVQNYGAHINVTPKMRAFLHYLGIHLKDSTGEIVIPARPFMDNAKKRIQGEEGQRMVMQEIFRVLDGRQTMIAATDRLGLWAQGIIQEEIKNITTPPLSNATIEIRNNEYQSKSKNKSTKPLNTSGLMFSTVQHKCGKKGTLNDT